MEKPLYLFGCPRMFSATITKGSSCRDGDGEAGGVSEDKSLSAEEKELLYCVFNKLQLQQENKECDKLFSAFERKSEECAAGHKQRAR